jgi:hypothetical protein
MQKLLLMVMVGLSLGGCATVTRGTTDKVEVITEPAGAQVTTSLGPSCPSTPCTVEVARKSEFVVIVTKPGYRDASVPVATKFSGSGAASMAGNIILPGGTIGVVTDAATGASLDHVPNPVRVTLVPRGGKPRRPRRMTRRVSGLEGSGGTLWRTSVPHRA